MIPRLVAVACASILTLSACSGPPTSEEPAPQVTTVAQSPSADPSESASKEGVADYFRLFATNDPDEMEKAVKLAAPKSPAEAYMIHQAAAEGAIVDSGTVAEPDSVDATDAGYELCPMDSTDCTQFTDLKTVGGKLSNFSVNGKAIAPRLSLGKGDEVRVGSLATVEFVSAYKAASEDLFVTMVIRSKGRELSLSGLYSARYREPGGRQVTARDAYGSTTLDPKSRARASLIFPKAKPGGTVTVTVADAETYDDASARFKI